MSHEIDYGLLLAALEADRDAKRKHIEVLRGVFPLGTEVMWRRPNGEIKTGVVSYVYPQTPEIDAWEYGSKVGTTHIGTDDILRAVEGSATDTKGISE